MAALCDAISWAAIIPSGSSFGAIPIRPATAALYSSPAPLVELIRRHVLAGERLHDDDTTVPVLAKDKTASAGCGLSASTRAGVSPAMPGSLRPIPGTPPNVFADLLLTIL